MMPATGLALTGAMLCIGAFGAVFGGQFVASAGPTTDLASRFARPDAETAARAACASSAPFVVLDTFAHFKPANIDDNLADSSAEASRTLQHGDIVAAIVEASHPGVVTYQTDPIFNVRTLAADFARVAADIESGKLAKPAAVVSSIVLPVDLGVINALASNAAPFNDENLGERRDEFMRRLTGGFDPGNPYTDIDRELRRLRAAGVPVFVAAGNTGPDDNVNALALSEGVFAIGALGRDGTAASYTSAPGFVSIWSPGFVVLSETSDGLSVSGGRKTELGGAEMPEEKAVIASFSGRVAAEVVQEPPPQFRYPDRRGPSRQRDRYIRSSLAPGIYRTSDLMTAYGYAASLGTHARAVADGPYIHFPTDTIFGVDAAGRLLFDPIGDRSVGQLKVADATSFAAPNLCATELFAKRRASLTN